MSDENITFPHTAITTWSGFVYQGKVALYHALILINNGDEDFELQLDSSDDFAIYKGNLLMSIHQVKARIGHRRSAYEGALEKSANSFPETVNTIQRFLHVSVEINDTSDYLSASQSRVSFYDYDGKKHCGLGEIETISKLVLTSIFDKKSLIRSQKVISHVYRFLSEKISNKAMSIHKMVQEEGIAERRAAFDSRISASELLTEMESCHPRDDIEYMATELRARLFNFLEMRIDEDIDEIDDVKFHRARKLFEYIRTSDAASMRSLCQLMNPAEKFSTIQKRDIRGYSRLIDEMSHEPVLNGIPHYKDSKQSFYLPTAIELYRLEDYESCRVDLEEEMSSNPELLELLFEYNYLIASESSESFSVNTKFTNALDFDDITTREDINSNITKNLCISVLSRSDAERCLDD